MLSILEFSEELGDRLLEIAVRCSVLSSLRGLLRERDARNAKHELGAASWRD